MAQFILDEQLFPRRVLHPVQAWTSVAYIHDVRPGEIVKDERIPQILRAAKRPTFITIDSYFYNERLRDIRYCILYFALTNNEQYLIPALLRGLVRHTPFTTIASRMGIVARISSVAVDFIPLGQRETQRIQWSDRRRR